MLDPYLSCTYVKMYFIFSNGKEKKKKRGGVYIPSCYSWQQLWQWPCNQLTSFQNRLSNHRAKRLRSALKKDTKGSSGGFFYFFFVCFWSIIFPRQSFFLSITGKKKKKRNSTCIELVNIQKLYFLFPLEELHFVSKFTDNGFYFWIFSVWELPWGHDDRDAELSSSFACRDLAPRQYWTRSSSCRRVDNEPAFTQHVILYFSASYTATTKPRNRRDVRCVYPF